ncbi:hypothetical protein FPHYL_13594 [Fusarium phyllophilum]|uniref:Uncharacterized protein n=1 Tax=Fusarium phyllophilum TaxID=47803 RepID=A0A8H5IB77_9HYPO|nr:hypothetical protein FPHYL_13594 [Fusarium phyllophilum]
MSSQRAPFDPAQLPSPANLGQRRGYIEQYIQRFHRDLVPKMAARREAAIAAVCKFYHEDLHVMKAPAVYFEYAVDKTMWKNICKLPNLTYPVYANQFDSQATEDASCVALEQRADLPVPSEEETGTSSGKAKATEKTPTVTEPAAPKQPQTEVGSSSGKGKAAEKTPKVTNPPATNQRRGDVGTSSGTRKTAEKTPKPAAPSSQTRNGGSSKSKSDAPVMRVAKNGTVLRLDGGKWVRVPNRLAGLKMTPMAAPKDLLEGQRSMYASLAKDLHDSLDESLIPSAGAATKAPSVASAAESQTAASKSKAPSAASAPSTKGMGQTPVEIDFSMRETAWASLYGDEGGYLGGAVFAPFALRVPGCLDFEYLVLGEDGRDIDAINNDILESGLAVSWKTHDNKPIALVVGFKDEASRALPKAESGLANLWCDVVAWYVDALSGGTVSLATTLRVVQVLSWSRDRVVNYDLAQYRFYFARDNKKVISEMARKAREDVLTWSPMVNAIIEKPLGVGERELFAWVCDKTVGSEECYRRLRTAHHVWFSSTTDPKVMRRAALCLDDCSLALDSA